MLRKMVLSISLSLVGLLSYVPSVRPSWTYHYHVVAHSSDPRELVALYEQKETMIRVYEDIILPLEENDRAIALSQSLGQFAKDDRVKVLLINGVLVATIGDGQGLTIEGDFQRFQCGPENPRYRFFILDWLLGNG